MKWGLISKLLAVILAFLTPFILIIFNGPLGALSQYWNTPFQPLFIITNAMTSYFFFHFRSWWIPSIFLLGLTAFSYNQFPLFHNILAITFFLTSGYTLFKTKKYMRYFYIYLIALIIIPFNLLIGEILAVMGLCAYHFHMLLFKHRLL